MKDLRPCARCSVSAEIIRLYPRLTVVYAAECIGCSHATHRPGQCGRLTTFFKKHCLCDFNNGEWPEPAA